MTGELAIAGAGMRDRTKNHSGALMNNSAEIVRRVCQGDDEAFRLIFERYAQRIVSFVFHLVGSYELAEELAQETFIRAYRNMERLRDASKLSSWLFGIAHNVVRESYPARQKEHRRVPIDDPLVGETRDEQPSLDGQLLGKELEQLVTGILEKLTEDQRLVFTLKVFQQRSYEEIAEITGFSIPNVKTVLHRARVEVQRRMHPFLESVQ
ncbi:MAG TPA: RNA polymerase sigma factor [Pyrinomonadaceae bacterium]